MSRASLLKKIAVFLLCLLGLLIVAIAGLLGFANTETGRRTISDTATRILEREVEFSGSIGLRPRWPLAVRVTGLRVANHEEGRAEDMLDIDRVVIGWSPLPLIFGTIKLPYVFVDGGKLYLERKADGRANWLFEHLADDDDEDEEQTRPDDTRVRLGTLYLRDAVLSYYDQIDNIDVVIHASTEQGDLSTTGKGTFYGEPFSLELKGGAILEAREDVPYPIDLTLTVGQTTLHAEGILHHPTELAGMDMTLQLRGADASDLYPLLGIALPPTAPYDIEGKLLYSGGIWRFEDFKGRMGESDLSGNVEWDTTRARPTLTANFLSKNLDFDDLAPLIGSEKGVLDDETKPYVIPDMPLDISRLAAMDADIEFIGEQILSPALPLDDFLLRVSLNDRLMRINPIRFGTADGDISARMRINAREEPVEIAADFRFARLSLERLTEGVRKVLPRVQPSKGYIGGTARMKGYGRSLKEMLSTANGNIGVGMSGGEFSHLLLKLMGLDVARSLGSMVAGDKPVPIHCIIGDFLVEDGVMQSRAIVLDTNSSLIKGEGTINLQNEEMRLRLLAEPKDGTLASLRTPLRVEGTMKNPEVSLEKGPLIARGAGVVALSIALTPIAGIVALMEPPVGQDSDCAGLLEEMESRTRSRGEASEVPRNPMPESIIVEDEVADDTSPQRVPRSGDHIAPHPGKGKGVIR